MNVIEEWLERHSIMAVGWQVIDTETTLARVALIHYNENQSEQHLEALIHATRHVIANWSNELALWRHLLCDLEKQREEDEEDAPVEGGSN